MATAPRSHSESDIYHVTTRGVGKQILFEDDRDRIKFGAFLRKCLEKYDGSLYAWCFMQNHVHLLPRFKSFDLPAFMRQLLSEYAHYYNKRHDHVGHVFQSRYGSVPINDDDQLLTVVRYIHQNPKGMGFPRPGDYKWSSYREYIGSPFITDTSLILDILGGIEPFIEFHETCDDSLSKVPFDNKRRPSIPDDEAVKLAKSLTGCKELSDIASCQKPERDARLALLKDNGFTIAQIARLTGIGRNIIQRARQP